MKLSDDLVVSFRSEANALSRLHKQYLVCVGLNGSGWCGCAHKTVANAVMCITRHAWNVRRDGATDRVVVRLPQWTVADEHYEKTYRLERPELVASESGDA